VFATLVEVDEETFARLRLAARVAGITPGEVIARALDAYSVDTGPPVDPWEPMPVYVVYAGTRVDGMFTPATERLVITSEPLRGKGFKSPSGAARAVVQALSPEPVSGNVSGWRFWRSTSTDDRLEVFRRK
jgi:hypothetical protein